MRRLNWQPAVFWVVFAIEAASLVYVVVAPEHWLRCVGGMALGFFVAAAARSLLSDEHAGLLRVRHRALDVAFYLGAGVLAITFGLALHQR